MRRFIKYFLAIFSVVSAVFVALLHWSGFQKACLLGVLRCSYKDVKLENFHGGAAQISWDKISCKTQKDTLTISNFELKWHPWRLVFGRTLSIDELHGDVDFMGDGDDLRSLKTQHAGWFLNGDRAKTYSILKSLQSPLKLDIALADLNLKFLYKDVRLQEGHLKLQDMHPGKTGVCNYSGQVVFPQQVRMVMAGEFLLQASDRGTWEKIRCSGSISTFYKTTRYPRLSFSGVVDGIASTAKEEVRAEIHCGQANDFLITGEYVKDSNRVYDFKWQGFFDHSLLKFLNMTARPVLSILTEGNCTYNRKHHIWTTHTNLSAWGKHFEAIHPSLKSLPCLSFKAQLDADVGAKQIDLKQYKFVLKEKGASRLFLDVTSLHPLTYIYKGNRIGLPAKEDSQIFEVNFYETPFEIFNPYLKQYGFQIAGNLQSGNVNVGWNAKEKQWTIATFQPICAQVRQLKKNNEVCVKDVTFRLSEKCALDRNSDEVNYEMNLVASDLKHVSFFKFSPKGYVDLKNKTILGEGVFSLDNSWAKDLFLLEPLGVKLNPDLLAKLNYNFEYRKGELLVNLLKLSLSSNVDKTIAMELKTEQPLYFSDACWKKTKSGDIASFVARNYPLDFAQYIPSALFGVCNGQLSFKKSNGSLQCSSDVPLSISNFKWCANSEDRLLLNNIFLDFKVGCDENLRWFFDLAKASIVSDNEKQPLFAGNCTTQGVKSNLESSNGQIVFSLDKLCAQPVMFRYPGFVGEFNSHWIFNEKQAEANGRLRFQPLESDFAVEAKSFYKRSEKPLLKASLELQSNARFSDVYADTTWDKTGSIDCQVHSENLFVGDFVQCYEDLKTLGNKFASCLVVKNDGTKPNVTILDKQSVPADIAEKPEKVSKKEIPFQGLVHLNLKSINTDMPFLENLNGTIAIKKDAIHTENVQGLLCSGKMDFKADYRVKNDHLEVSANGIGVDVGWLSKVPGGIGYPLDKYGQITGRLDTKMHFSGELGNPFSWYGFFDMNCKDGCYKAFNASSKTGIATLGLLLTANVSAIGVVGFLASYAQGIPFNEITCSCSRDIANKIVCKGSAINDDLAISLEGSVGMKQGLSRAQQPLDCSLKFSAPIRSPFLNYFAFDAIQKDKNGYCVGPNCRIGGTLGSPDYSSLIKLITSARNEKSEAQKKITPMEQLLKTLL